jgi:hypothetical protein
MELTLELGAGELRDSVTRTRQAITLEEEARNMVAKEVHTARTQLLRIQKALQAEDPDAFPVRRILACRGSAFEVVDFALSVLILLGYRICLTRLCRMSLRTRWSRSRHALPRCRTISSANSPSWIKRSPCRCLEQAACVLCTVVSTSL